jgi:hypothetical protein
LRYRERLCTALRERKGNAGRTLRPQLALGSISRKRTSCAEAGGGDQPTDEQTPIAETPIADAMLSRREVRLPRGGVVS